MSSQQNQGNQKAPIDALKIELYRQTWEQSRHNERLREGVSVLFGLTVAGMLAVLAQRTDVLGEWWPWAFLLPPALLGFSVSWRARNNTRRHTSLREDIETAVGIRNWPPRNEVIPDHGPRIDIAYVVFYGIISLALVVVAIWRGTAGAGAGS